MIGSEGMFEFQYLKGAIGRRLCERPNPQQHRFQYLKGAIGRWTVDQTEIRSKHFNTSKVRLEVVCSRIV